MTKEAIQQQMAAVRAASERLRLEREKLSRMIEDAKAQTTWPQLARQ